MFKIIAALVGGALLGIFVMFAADRIGPSAEVSQAEVVRDILDVPKLAPTIADKHRDTLYLDLKSVTDVITLPTEFARSEALYVLAGRSDSARIQQLIFESNRIADDIERISLLNILFFRLAEADPQTALALARDESFKSVKAIERTVWRAWARNDLEDALFAAKVQTTVAGQNSAAQSLYAAFGYMGNETTDQIESELGIGPDRSSRGRYLYKLADRSPADAINYINTLLRGTEQEQYVSWLAYYVALRDPNEALGHADLFVVASDGEYYKRIINREIAREDPRVAMERLLAEGTGSRMTGEYHTLIRELASTDIDAAKQYFEQARSSDMRRTFGRAIAMQMAKNDPIGALAWARENDTEQFPSLRMSVLSQIARSDPQLAMTEALNTTNSQIRSNILSNVLQNIARTSPADAVVYLDQIQDHQQKLQAGMQLVSSWIRSDPDAAINWILSQDEETSGQMIQFATTNLIRSDVDAAIRMLPRVDEKNQAVTRQQIAESLARTRSPDEAQNFIRQFEGQPGYDQLQASLISGVAATDVMKAKQLADQLSAGGARDRAYMQVISQRAQTNPNEAIRWLRSMSNESTRASAAGQLVAQWAANDPVAAERWTSSLPVGPSRDEAIMQISYRWRETTAAQDELIASIRDSHKRGQAKVRRAYALMRTDPAQARALLQDEDIPDYQRQQIEMTLNQIGSRL